jgi:hypothetical protein
VVVVACMCGSGKGGQHWDGAGADALLVHRHGSVLWVCACQATWSVGMRAGGQVRGQAVYCEKVWKDEKCEYIQGGKHNLAMWLLSVARALIAGTELRV